MKILITNDDGIASDGLFRLAKEAAKWGEVWVVAPDSQRSAASHSLTIGDPLEVCPVDMPIERVKAFSCSGLPSDCVRLGSKYIMPEEPDVVFSGINNGYNVGTDIQYSATVGAALDAAMCGYPAVAWSEGFMGDERQSASGHQVTDLYLPIIMEEILKQDLVPHQVININFPDCPIDTCKGVLRNRKVSMGNPYVDIYRLREEREDGSKQFTIHWVDRNHADEGTDLRAILDGYISIGIVNNIS
ncbi:MAG: 5'/3'-nucleotidase SurE [Clostridiales bacterium]|nr:5'/3'-nucleotidase SurE [Clostridiales bacterium]